MLLSSLDVVSFSGVSLAYYLLPLIDEGISASYAYSEEYIPSYLLIKLFMLE